MLSKNEAKYIQSLTHKKTRAEERTFIAEGEKIIAELLQSDFTITRLFASETWIEANPQYPAIQLTEADLKKISNLQTPPSVIALVKQPDPAPLPSLHNNVILMLDGIQDPGNLGTIIRTADWFGIASIIAAKDTADLYNPKVIQSTMGSFTRVKLWYENLEELLQEVTVPVYGALLEGEDIRRAGKIKEGIVVIGNEGKGIRPALLPFINRKVTITKGSSAAESLNASVATGIILSHLT